MRRRLYYTDRQIVKNLYTTGSEWQTTDGKEYIGPYHTYITGEVFTQPDWNETTSKELIKFEVKDQNVLNYQSLKNIQVKYETPQPAIIQVTNLDRTNGFITRYIAKKYNETKIIEIDKLQFDKWLENKIDQNIWQIIPVYWKISGPLTTQIKGAVTTLGVREQNTKTVIDLESRIPGISMFLNNPIQYYTDTEFVVPRDINAR
jgi:hypothetical protein